MLTALSRVIVWALQLGYVWHLFSTNTEYVTSAANVGSHFVANNLLQFGWVMLWSRSHFWWAELLLIVNFFNLASLYFRHSNYARFIHIPVVSAPLAWTFVAIFWNGAVMVNAHTLVARIFANIAIWGILVFGLFFLVVFKDYTIGFELSVLSACESKIYLTKRILANVAISPWRRPIPHQSHCLPVDLCFYYHGHSFRLLHSRLGSRSYRWQVYLQTGWGRSE